MNNFHPDTKLWYLGPDWLSHLNLLCMTKKVSGKDFFTALVCVKCRVWGTVIHQHKFTKAGAATVLCFLLVSDFSSLSFTDSSFAPPSNELFQKDVIRSSNPQRVKSWIIFWNFLICNHEYQDFHKGGDKKAHLGRQYCDSPSISYLEHCKASLVITLLLFHGLMTRCSISPSYPELISTRPSPSYTFPI